MSMENKGSLTADIVVSMEPDRSGNYICSGAADNVEVLAAVTEASRRGGGKVLLKEGTYVFAAAVTIPQDVHVEGMGWWATVIRLDTDTGAFVLSNTRSSLRRMGFSINIDAGYGVATPVVLVTAGVLAVEDIRYWRSGGFSNTRGIALYLYTAAASNNSVGWSKFNRIYISGPFSQGVYLYNTGVFPDEWINANHFTDIWVPMGGAAGTVGFQLEATDTGEIAANFFDRCGVANALTGYYIDGADRNEFYHPFAWDMGVGSTNINIVSGDNNMFRDGFINPNYTTTLTSTTEMLNVIGYVGELLEVINFAFTQPHGGDAAWVTSLTAESGIDIDAQGEAAFGFCYLPDWVDHVYMVRMGGVANVAEADSMNAKLYVYAGGDNDAWNRESCVSANHHSESVNFADNDYIYWEFTASDDGDLDDIVGGDFMTIILDGWVADGDHCATDVLMQSGKVYVTRRD